MVIGIKFDICTGNSQEITSVMLTNQCIVFLFTFLCISANYQDTKVLLYESLLKAYLAFREEHNVPVLPASTRRFLDPFDDIKKALYFSTHNGIVSNIVTVGNLVNTRTELVHKTRGKDVCGISKYQFHQNGSDSLSRIVGGVDAQYGAWPWIAALGYEVVGGVKFLCGGTLITRKHVLTAAHCVYERPSLQSVLLGATALTLADEQGARRIRIAHRRIHDFYKPESHSNDIAILSLESPVVFTDKIRAACLPLPKTFGKEDYKSKKAIVAGWGALSYGGRGNPILQQVEVNILDEELCTKAYKPVNQVIDSGILCAGYVNGTKDACQGDSGGPLVFENKGSFYLIGVVSFGYRCGEANYPGVYTNVAYFHDWITNSIYKIS